MNSTKPIKDCEHAQADGCCGHPDAPTPECHVSACLRLAAFVENLLSTAERAYAHLGRKGYAYEGVQEYDIVDEIKHAIGAASGEPWAEVGK